MEKEDRKFLEGLKRLPVKEAEAILEFATREFRPQEGSEMDKIGEPFEETRKRIKEIEEKALQKLGSRAKLFQPKPRRARKPKDKS